MGMPVAFVESGGLEDRLRSGSGAAPSLYNAREAAVVVGIARQLVDWGGLPGGAADIGIITPYSAQVGQGLYISYVEGCTKPKLS